MTAFRGTSFSWPYFKPEAKIFLPYYQASYSKDDFFGDANDAFGDANDSVLQIVSKTLSFAFLI